MAVEHYYTTYNDGRPQSQQQQQQRPPMYHQHISSSSNPAGAGYHSTWPSVALVCEPLSSTSSVGVGSTVQNPGSTAATANAAASVASASYSTDRAERQDSSQHADTEQSAGKGNVRLRAAQACMLCRRQKMKCEGPSKHPCKRCLNAKVECVFDQSPGWSEQKPVQVNTTSASPAKERSSHRSTHSEARMSPYPGSENDVRLAALEHKVNHLLGLESRVHTVESHLATMSRPEPRLHAGDLLAKSDSELWRLSAPERQRLDGLLSRARSDWPAPDALRGPPSVSSAWSDHASSSGTSLPSIRSLPPLNIMTRPAFAAPPVRARSSELKHLSDVRLSPLDRPQKAPRTSAHQSPVETKSTASTFEDLDLNTRRKCCDAYFDAVASVDQRDRASPERLDGFSRVLGAAITAIGARLLAQPDILKKAQAQFHARLNELNESATAQANLCDFCGALLYTVYFGDEGLRLGSCIWVMACRTRVAYAFVDAAAANPADQAHFDTRKGILLQFWQYFELMSTFAGLPVPGIIPTNAMEKHWAAYLAEDSGSRPIMSEGPLRAYFSSILAASKAITALDPLKSFEPIPISTIERVVTEAWTDFESHQKQYGEWLVSAVRTQEDEHQAAIPYHVCAFALLNAALGNAPARNWLLSSPFLIKCVRDVVSHGLAAFSIIVNTRHWHLHSPLAQYTFTVHVKSHCARMTELAILVPEHVDARELGLSMQRLVYMYDQLIVPSPYATSEAKSTRSTIVELIKRLENAVGFVGRAEPLSVFSDPWTEEDERATRELLRFDTNYWHIILPREIFAS